jgi:limonene-1,2-epoxide hydrolase
MAQSFITFRYSQRLGRIGSAKTIDGLLTDVLKGVTQIKINVLRTASSGGVVFDERVDSFELNGKWVPVVGVFEMTPAVRLRLARLL